MLATFFLSKSTKTQIILPFQRLNITFNVIRTNLSSSSSDSSSSDSDSDLDAEISNEIRDKLRGIDYLQSAKAARKRRQIEHELTKAAQILTTTSDQDKGKILSVLLDSINKIQTIDNTSSKSKEDEAKDKTRTINNESKEPQKLSTIHKLQSQQKEVRDVSDKVERKYERQKEPSIIEMLKSQSSMRKDIDDKFEKEYERRMEPSVIHKLQSQQKEVRDVSDKLGRKRAPQKKPSIIKMPKYETLRKSSIVAKLMSQQKGSSIIDDNERDNIDYERIFDDFPENTDVPKLKMWDTWEREQLQFLTSKYPTNSFQEMIQWSKEGKLWKFPIDNEQGMEKEQNVHFSKHVFLERELIPWCPPKGPIRHFMELVCVGLSKNPYMTIEEKYNHIMWYKNYFNDKHDLLKKLGILG